MVHTDCKCGGGTKPLYTRRTGGLTTDKPFYKPLTSFKYMYLNNC